MQDLIVHRQPKLNRPVLIAAFGGWNDAGHAATSAAQHLMNAWSAERFAEFDPEAYCDFTATRPWVRHGAGDQRRIEWPEIVFYAHRGGPDGTDAIVLLGPEPAIRWPQFSAQVVDLAKSLDVSMAITFGAYLGGGTHLDPIHLSGWASPDSLRRRLRTLDVDAIAYEGSTGMVTVLGSALAEAEIPVAAIWAAVPAYLGRIPNPKGNLALLSVLDRALNLGLDLSNLEQIVQRFDARVSEAVRYVRRESGTQLLPASEPEASGRADTPPPGELPSSEEVLRDVEEFFRRGRDAQ